MEALDQLKKSARGVQSLAAEVVDWYWNYGVRRNEFKMNEAWLLDLYERGAAASGINGALEHGKLMAAVWGPSQAGKSVFLSQFIDAPDQGGSALNWPNQPAFRFRESAKFPEIPWLNPFNFGSDASGCVTRFYSTYQPKHPSHPVEISLASRSQILQALALGYLTECNFQDVVDDKLVATSWDATNIIDKIIGSFNENGGLPSRDGFEVLLDVVTVIDNLLLAEEPRYLSLRISNAWRDEIVPRMMATSSLTKSPNSALSAGFKLLWDDRSKLNSFFARLDNYRGVLSRKVNDKKVFCSLEFAAMLLDIESYARFFGKNAAQARDKLSRAVIHEDNHALYIDLSNQGSPLFSGPDQFGFMQALVWELAIPLSRAFLEQEARGSAAAFLEKFDLLDIPGVAQKHRSAESTLINLERDSTTDKDLLLTVLKRGKTATIINQYGRDNRIDLLLLLVRAGLYIAQPQLLIGGVRGIWRARKPDYLEGHGNSPTPIVVGLTFFNKIVNQIAESAGGPLPLEGLENMLSQLGPILQKNVSRLFATAYPQFAEGRILVEQERHETVSQRILSHSWIKERFPSEAEQKSISEAINSDDGGVSYLLDVLLTENCESRTDLYQSRLEEIVSAIVFRTKEALPRRDEASEKNQLALREFMSAIERKCSLANEGGVEEKSEEVSLHLRTLLSFQTKDFEPVPIGLRQKRGRAKEYALRQLVRWAGRDCVRKASAEFKLDQEIVSRAYYALRSAISAEELTDFCVEVLGDIEEERMARHARRYFAAKCASLLSEAAGASVSTISSAELMKNYECQVDAWERHDNDYKRTMHFERVIGPYLKLMGQLAETAQGTRWQTQPGDDVIELLWQNLNSELCG